MVKGKRLNKRGEVFSREDEGNNPKNINIKLEATLKEKQKKERGSSILSIIVAIFLVLGIAWFFFFTDAGNVWWGKITGVLGPVGNGIGGFFGELANMILNPREAFGTWKNPSPVDIGEKEDEGVRIRNVETTRSSYVILPVKSQSDNYITAIGEVDVKNLKEKTSVVFSCFLELEILDGSKKAIEGEVAVPSKQKQFSKKNAVAFDSKKRDEEISDESFVVQCRIPKQEIDVEEIGKDDFTGMIAIEAEYGAKTRATLRVYTIDREMSNDEMRRFKSSLSSENILEGKRLRAQTRGGAMDGFIDIKADQPIREIGGYFISIGLKDTKWEKGKIRSLDGINLVDADGRISIDYESCSDFEKGLIKKEIKDDVNKCLEEEKTFETKEMCEAFDADNIEFSCLVNINELYNKNYNYDLIKADFSYVYMVVGSTRADFKVLKK